MSLCSQILKLKPVEFSLSRVGDFTEERCASFCDWRYTDDVVRSTGPCLVGGKENERGKKKELAPCGGVCDLKTFTYFVLVREIDRALSLLLLRCL